MHRRNLWNPSEPPQPLSLEWSSRLTLSFPGPYFLPISLPYFSQKARAEKELMHGVKFKCTCWPLWAVDALNSANLRSQLRCTMCPDKDKQRASLNKSIMSLPKSSTHKVKSLSSVTLLLFFFFPFSRSPYFILPAPTSLKHKHKHNHQPTHTPPLATGSSQQQ